MAVSESVKIAKIEKSKQINLALIDVGKSLTTNPIIELIGAFVLIEYLQRTPKSSPILGNWQGNLLETGVGGIIAVQQLAPSLPYLVKAGGEAMGSLNKLIPLL